MSSHHTTSSQGGSMRNRPYSTSGGHASGRSSNHDMVNRRHSAAPSSGSASRQRTYTAYRPPPREAIHVAYVPSEPPVAPRPLRPAQLAPPAWIHDNFDSDPVQGEQHTYFESCDRYETSPVLEEPSSEASHSRHQTPAASNARQPVPRETVPPPRRPKSPQSFGQILKSAPPAKKRSFWSRIFCGSPDEPAANGASRGLISADEGKPLPALPGQPGVRERRKARHAGDEEGPYVVKTGRDADKRQSYYAPRYQG
ncbi:hypothetical protein PG984_003051 [Apiospora sp. TS-2023a]